MALTISHHPYGNGHPYAVSTDQRNPVFPVAGEPVWLGVVTTGTVETVDCEIIRVDTRQVLSCVRTSEEDLNASVAANTGGEGHLAEAQAASLHSDGEAWHAIVKHPLAQETLRYRFIATGVDGEVAETGWTECRVAEWIPMDDDSQHLLTVVKPDDMPINPSNIRILSDGVYIRRIRFTLPLTRAEHVVGLGERYDSLDQKGLAPDSIVFEQYKDQGAMHRTYFPMPFAHVTGGIGWGFHLHTSRRVWFDIAKTNSTQFIVEAETGEDGRLELSLYKGSPTEVLSAYLDETGRAKQLPSWVHRLWASGNEWNTQQLVMERMNQHRDADIPVGVAVIEAWSDEEEITIFRDAEYQVNEDGAPHKGEDFTYPEYGAWPDPKDMIRELHRRGIKVILWQIPLIKSEETFNQEHQDHGRQVIIDGETMVRKGYAVREENGQPYHNRAWWFPKALMPDLSTKKGREWWADHRRYLVEDYDIDGFKTDGGEHAWGRELKYHDGTKGEDGNNLNPVRYAQTYCELLESCGKPPVTFSRSGYTGSQQYGAFWAGDENSTWEAFRSSLRAGLSAGACGVVYWGWDMAGFSGPVPTPELYIRAAAASVFMPIMQYHSEFNHHELPLRDRTPWNIAEQTGDKHVIDEFRTLAKLREKLVPYLTESAKAAIETDRPLMRALFFDYTEDRNIWEYPFEYQLGDSLLINPVCEENATSMSTYLPSTNNGSAWVDVWTGEPHQAGTIVETDVTERTMIPVFCVKRDWIKLKEIFV